MTSEQSSLSAADGETEFNYIYRGCSLAFRLHANVAKPNYYSFFLGEHLPRSIEGSALDVGTGTGFLAILIASIGNARILATDINPFAVTFATDNALLNGVSNQIQFKQGDLLTPVGDEIFDLIVCDPPFAPTPPDLISDLLSRSDWFYTNACGGPEGRDFIDRFIAQVFDHLKPSGRLLLVHPDYVNIQRSINAISDAGLIPRIIAKQVFPLGTLGMQRRPYIETQLGFRFNVGNDGALYQTVMIIEGRKRM